MDVYQRQCAKLSNRLLFLILMVLNTDQIVKAGRWQDVAQKLGSFLHWKSPEVAHTPLWYHPCGVPSPNFFLAPGELIYLMPPVFCGSPSHCPSLPTHHGLEGKLVQGRCCVMSTVAVPWPCRVSVSPVNLTVWTNARAGPRDPKQPSSQFWELSGDWNEIWVQIVGVMKRHQVDRFTKNFHLTLPATHIPDIWRVK